MKQRKPNELAADLLSQAEHDARACSVLVTTSRELAEAVSAEVDRQLETLPRKRLQSNRLLIMGSFM